MRDGQRDSDIASLELHLHHSECRIGELNLIILIVIGIIVSVVLSFLIMVYPGLTQVPLPLEYTTLARPSRTSRAQDMCFGMAQPGHACGGVHKN